LHSFPAHFAGAGGLGATCARSGGRNDELTAHADDLMANGVKIDFTVECADARVEGCGIECRFHMYAHDRNHTIVRAQYRDRVTARKAVVPVAVERQGMNRANGVRVTLPRRGIRRRRVRAAALTGALSRELDA
jgi:hypothetical protein